MEALIYRAFKARETGLSAYDLQENKKKILRCSANLECRCKPDLDFGRRKPENEREGEREERDPNVFCQDARGVPAVTMNE